MDYQIQLAAKVSRLSALLSPFFSQKIAVYPSKPEGFRMRAEFRIWRDDGKLSYAMTPKGARFHRDTVIKIHSLPAACPAINDLMPKLLAWLQNDAVLQEKLYQVEFLTTKTGDMLVTLIYHRQLQETWQIAAQHLAVALKIAIVGRARKQKVVIGRDFVRERLQADGAVFEYIQFEQSFAQPNAQVCEKMLDWACAQVGYQSTDLLELYCGNGNFTLPLSRHFRRVLATEISKSGITALRENIKLNHIDNIDVARLSAEEFTQAFRGMREFTRLKQDNIYLSDYNFSFVFVDPPRAGIDENTLALLSEFPKILYISCNPETLVSNLQQLSQSHTVVSSALFDQFPFSEHIESGVLLVRKEQK